MYFPLRCIHADREVVIATVNFTEDASTIAAVAVVALPAGVHEPLETYDHLSLSSHKLKTQNKTVIVEEIKFSQQHRNILMEMQRGHISSISACNTVLLYKIIPIFKLITSPNFLKNMAKRRLKTFVSPEFSES